jgi:hypothetical protein
MSLGPLDDAAFRTLLRTQGEHYWAGYLEAVPYFHALYAEPENVGDRVELIGLWVEALGKLYAGDHPCPEPEDLAYSFGRNYAAIEVLASTS